MFGNISETVLISYFKDFFTVPLIFDTINPACCSPLEIYRNVKIIHSPLSSYGADSTPKAYI